ncbi:PREDICTED: leucine-rich repeat extensin-like protein 1 [Camelina sativa]|uniref:Leucine-rich repeat extensin-like protein 1 n=1 Tax=Camelina sativa TaxID=90675 RepID=A0ABM0TSP2_CAMSA|nr:PREDICTED: leucine-rich repeat extensin-like protein 1 [Camelina sativa]
MEGTLIGYSWIQLLYALLCSILITFFLLPPLCFFLKEIVWLLFVERIFELFLFLIALACVSCYLFRHNGDYCEEEDEELDFPVPSSDLHSDLPYHPYLHSDQPYLPYLYFDQPYPPYLHCDQPYPPYLHCDQPYPPYLYCDLPYPDPPSSLYLAPAFEIHCSTFPPSPLSCPVLDPSHQASAFPPSPPSCPVLDPSLQTSALPPSPPSCPVLDPSHQASAFLPSPPSCPVLDLSLQASAFPPSPPSCPVLDPSHQASQTPETMSSDPPPLSRPSSPQLSLHSASSSPISLSSPPPPPFRMKPWKAFIQGDYAWIASDVSLSSSDDSDFRDVDTKADRFITKFKNRLKAEKGKTA